MGERELAQKILALIERVEQETAQEETSDVDENIYRGIVRYVRLKAAIKTLCEEQIKEQG